MMNFPGHIESVSLNIPEQLKNSYPFNIPCIHNLNRLNFHPRVTFLVGENGMGKSTLLEGIAVGLGFNAEGGGKNFNFNTEATHSELHLHMRFAKGLNKIKDGYFLRAESFYNLASEIDALDRELAPDPPIIDSYGGKSLHKQSHGESFWSLFMHRFGGNGLYILDEPESALSVTRQMAMLVRMDKLIEKKSQFIIATHSPIILAYPNATIYQLSAEGTNKIKYKDTETYMLYKRFLDNPEQMTSMLLEDDEAE